MVEKKLGIKTDAIGALENRFSFAERVISEIEETKAQIAHPGWVQLTAAHPTPELPKLEKIKPTTPQMAKPMIPGAMRPESGMPRIGLSIAMPEIGERKKLAEEKKGTTNSFR